MNKNEWNGIMNRILEFGNSFEFWCWLNITAKWGRDLLYIRMQFYYLMSFFNLDDFVGRNYFLDADFSHSTPRYSTNKTIFLSDEFLKTRFLNRKGTKYKIYCMYWARWFTRRKNHLKDLDEIGSRWNWDLEVGEK